MSESQGVVGLDTQVKLGDGSSPEDFTLIPEAGDIEGPEITQDYADFTHQQSTGGFKEQKPTFKGSGQVTFKCTLVHGDATQKALIDAALASPATRSTSSLPTCSLSRRPSPRALTPSACTCSGIPSAASSPGMPHWPFLPRSCR